MTLTPNQIKNFDDYILEEFIPHNKIPGIAVSAVHDTSTVLASGYGKCDVESGTLATGDTLFLIASTTKTITSTVIVKALHEKFPELGEEVLDTPLAKLVPNYDIHFVDKERTDLMSFRDLLSHRSGLADTPFTLYFGGRCRDEFIRGVPYQKEKYQFRKKFAYNNGLYALAGHLVSKITGISYDQMILSFMHSIGMSTSTWVDPNCDFDKTSKGYIMKNGNLVPISQQFLRHVNVILEAGGVRASVRDMAEYLKFHINHGKVGDVQIMPEEVLRWVYKVSSNPFFYEEETDPTKLGYALGLSAYRYKGKLVYCHRGFWGPFSSLITISPEYKVGVFSVSNGPGGLDKNSIYTHENIHLNLLEMLALGNEEVFSDILGSDIFPDDETQTEKVIEPDVAQYSAPCSKNEFVGIYSDLEIGTVKIFQNCGCENLQIEVGEESGQLEQTAEDKGMKFNIRWNNIPDVLYLLSNGKEDDLPKYEVIIVPALSKLSIIQVKHGKKTIYDLYKK